MYVEDFWSGVSPLEIDSAPEIICWANQIEWAGLKGTVQKLGFDAEEEMSVIGPLSLVRFMRDVKAESIRLCSVISVITEYKSRGSKTKPQTE